MASAPAAGQAARVSDAWHGPAAELVHLVAAELLSEVCSVYATRAGEILELVATEGLNRQAIGRTRLRVGEGIVGLCAATSHVDEPARRAEPSAFAYRPETGEEPFASLLALPVRRAGRTYGVVAVQSPMPRGYRRRTGRTGDRRHAASRHTLSSWCDRRRRGGDRVHPAPYFTGARWSRASPSAPSCCTARGASPHVLAEDPEAELKRLHDAARPDAAEPGRADRRRRRRLRRGTAAAPHRARCWTPIA